MGAAGSALLRAIQCCGGPVEIQGEDGSYRFTACVQPRKYDSRQGQAAQPDPFGWSSPKRYNYYGPLTGGGELVTEGALLTACGKTFLVEAAHNQFFQGQAVYRKAVLRECFREEGTDGPIHQNETGIG